MIFKRFDDPVSNNVFKYVFEFEGAVAEAVLYKYNSFDERTVICCSVQSGCPVGCKFCGTGKQFIRNLTAEEIIVQIKTVLSDMGIEGVNSSCAKFQIMFMSMGEPMLNFLNVKVALVKLNRIYPNAQLLISTIGIDNDDTLEDLIDISKRIDKVGLQFSIHKSNDISRNALIPYKNKMNLSKLRDFGLVWWKETGRKPYLNYCIDETNSSESDLLSLTSLFSPVVFCLTFSVICSSDETMKESGYRNLDFIHAFSNKFLSYGYNVRVFNPDGQDSIGGGCGQLWYVQQWIKNNINNSNKS